MYLELLDRGIKEGIINLYLPTGRTYHFGDKGIETGWIIKSEDTIKRIARDWEYHLGETYVNGEWDVADCELRDLLGVLRRNFTIITQARWLRPFAQFLQQWNRITRSYSNVSYHYDLDEEVFRLHYMQTLHCWYDRFQQNRSEIKARMGERFCRMWEFYLSICEVAFQYSDLVVFQMQMAQKHSVVPITRDYLYSK